jgi:putative heme iron utilization protein
VAVPDIDIGSRRPALPRKRSPFKTKDGSVDVWFAAEYASIVDEVSSWKIICTINNDVVVLEEPQCIVTGQSRIMRFNLDMWIYIAQTIAG